MPLEPFDIVPFRPDDEPTICVRLNVEWISWILGMIYPYRYPENWKGTLEENRQARKDVITLLGLFMSYEDCDMPNDCCNDTTIIYNRISPLDGSTLERSFDGGITWQVSPDDPRNGIIIPPINIPGLPGQISKCDRAANAVQFLQDYVEGIADRTGSFVTILFEILADLIALLLLPTGVGASIVVLLIPVAQGLKQLGASAFRALFTTEVWEAVKCAMFCSLEDDGSLTRVGFALFTQKILELVPGDLHPLSAKTQLLGMVNAVGWIGMNLAMSTGSSSDAICDECDCNCNAVWSIWEGQGTDLTTGENETGKYVQVTAVQNDTYWGAGNYGAAIVSDGEFNCCRYFAHEFVAGEDTGGNWLATFCGQVQPVFPTIVHSLTGLEAGSGFGLNALAKQNTTAFTIRFYFEA